MEPWIVALVLAIGLWAGLRLARLLGRWRGRRRSRAGARGEKVALKLLRKRGYDVMRSQVRGTTTVRLDGEDFEFEVRADAMAQRDGRVFVAEFKTGAGATVANRNTRRQLLEYALTYDADALLLVDATARTITEVEFPQLTRSNGSRAASARP